MYWGGGALLALGSILIGIRLSSKGANRDAELRLENGKLREEVRALAEMIRHRAMMPAPDSPTRRLIPAPDSPPSPPPPVNTPPPKVRKSRSKKDTVKTK